MKYLCLVYFEGTIFDKMTPEEKKRLDQDSQAYDKSLMASGHFIAAEALYSPADARTVRMRRGQALTTDGPFAETKEQLGGFILINASGMDEALEIAAKIPLAQKGSVEVRPVLDFSK